MIVLLTLLVGTVEANGKDKNEIFQFSSPNKEISVNVFVKHERLSYSITSSSMEIIKPSPLGLIVDNIDLGYRTKLFSKPEKMKIKEKYSVMGNHPIAYNDAYEAVIPLEASGKKFDLIVRIYNDGVAIRYTLPKGTKRIDDEITSWNLPENIKKIAWSEFSSCYEELSFVSSLDEVPQNKSLMGPITIELENCYLSLSEADCETFSDMAFMRHGNVFKSAFPFAKEGWELTSLPDNSPLTLDGTYRGKKVSPWRTTIVAKNLTELVNSDLLTNVCPAPAKGSDFSWVKPGRCLWQWWSVGAPKYEDQKDWYDAAAKLKWEYYLIDDGWRYWKKEDRNQWELLTEVIEYGKSIGVQSIVWADSKEFRKAKERRAYLEKVKATGAVGIKIDFIPDATSEIMQWYMGTMQDCAEMQLLLNFHGSVKPTGLCRTYPNDITREAVRGNEYHILRYNRVLPLSHDVSLPFTRLMAGPADVTPVTLNPKELTTTKFTWAHEFAQAIVYLSPITHFCDHYKFYLESPMFDLFQQLPTVWDETLVLPCSEMGKTVAYARRSGKTWWIGIMNGDSEREVTVSLDFLKKSAKATLIYDTNVNTEVERQEKIVSSKDTLKIKMLPGGGWVARLCDN